MRGIILAGGSGSRLMPMTTAVSKQLLPIYNKPLIFYPLATLMEANIREILVITTPHDQLAFKKLLGDGSDFGTKIDYEIQPTPDGLAQAFLIGKDFIGTSDVALILGDNLFHGDFLPSNFLAASRTKFAEIFAYKVSNPTAYGVIELDKNSIPIGIEEKPSKPKSDLAVTGLYFFDNSVVSRALQVTPSPRGELEITEIINSYLKDGDLMVNILPTGTAWLDTGTPNSLHDAASYIRVIEERTGVSVGDVYKIASKKGWI
jgi:glucose-1-phosphate thymidylyltransferase